MHRQRRLIVANGFFIFIVQLGSFCVRTLAQTYGADTISPCSNGQDTHHEMRIPERDMTYIVSICSLTYAYRHIFTEPEVSH